MSHYIGFFQSEVLTTKKEFHLQIKMFVFIEWKHIARPRITGKQISASFDQRSKIIAKASNVITFNFSTFL
jgi:hypothetical protein